VSGVNYKAWDLIKLATALKIICDPPGTTLAETELFTGDELSMLLMDAHKYKNKLAKGTYLGVHKRVMMYRDFRARAQKLMVLFVTDGKRTFEAKRALQAKRRVIKKQLSVKLRLWPKKYWWFRLSPNKSHVATVNG
jgi:nucleolar protein 58